MDAFAHILGKFRRIDDFDVFIEAEDKAADALVAAYLGGEEVTAVGLLLELRLGGGIFLEKQVGGELAEKEFDQEAFLAGEVEEVLIEGLVGILVRPEQIDHLHPLGARELEGLVLACRNLVAAHLVVFGQEEIGLYDAVADFSAAGR